MDYSTPFVVKNEFQNTQKQTAWLAGEVVDNKKLLVQAHQDLEHLWVQFLQEHRYIRHLIEEHVLPLQKTVHANTPRDLSCVRNMVFFDLFLCYFARLSMLFYSPTFFPFKFHSSTKRYDACY